MNMHHDSHRKMLFISLLVVKLIAVYLLSIVSYFILDVMVWFDIVSSGLNPFVFILFIITRAGLAVFILSLFLGIQVLNSSKLGIDFVLAMLIFGVPIFSFIEVLRNLSGILIKIPLPPYVSLMQATLTIALLYEFPRLILFIVIRRFLYEKILAEGVR
jgi:hypothetical protein